jgi:hypothetical protein
MHGVAGSRDAPGGLAGVPRAIVEAAMDAGFHAAFAGCALVATASVAIALMTRDVPLRTTTGD